MNKATGPQFPSPQFAVLSDSQRRDIHLAAPEVLRRTGIRFHHRGALDLLKKAGAFISDGNLVKFPARMVWRNYGAVNPISGMPGTCCS